MFMIELQNKIGNRHCKYLKIIIKEIALRNFGTFLIPQPHVHCSPIYEGGNLESLFLQGMFSCNMYCSRYSTQVKKKTKYLGEFQKILKSFQQVNEIATWDGIMQAMLSQNDTFSKQASVNEKVTWDRRMKEEKVENLFKLYMLKDKLKDFPSLILSCSLNVIKTKINNKNLLKIVCN